MIDVSDFKKAWSDALVEIAQEDEDWMNETIHETIQAELVKSDIQEKLDAEQKAGSPSPFKEVLNVLGEALEGLKKSLDIK